jgi:hypothetical protein
VSETIELHGLVTGPVGDPGSPEWWRGRLLTRMFARRARLDLIADYVEGRHRMAFATSKYREAFGELLAPLRPPWSA